MPTMKRSRLVKKAKSLFSRIIRSRAGNCQKCGSVKKLQCSHIYTVGAHPAMQFTIENALCLCYVCHIFWWHKEVAESFKWFSQTFPNQAKKLEEIRFAEAQGKLPKLDAVKVTELIDIFEKELKGGEC